MVLEFYLRLETLSMCKLTRQSPYAVARNRLERRREEELETRKEKDFFNRC